MAAAFDSDDNPMLAIMLKIQSEKKFLKNVHYVEQEPISTKKYFSIFTPFFVYMMLILIVGTVFFFDVDQEDQSKEIEKELTIHMIKKGCLYEEPTWEGCDAEASEEEKISITMHPNPLLALNSTSCNETNKVFVPLDVTEISTLEWENWTHCTVSKRRYRFRVIPSHHYVRPEFLDHFETSLMEESVLSDCD